MIDISKGSSVGGAANFQDWNNMATTGLHQLQVGLVPFTVAPFGVYTPDQAPLPLPEVSPELQFPDTVQNFLNILHYSLCNKTNQMHQFPKFILS